MPRNAEKALAQANVPRRRTSDPRIDHIERRVDALYLEYEEHESKEDQARQDVMKELDNVKIMVKPVLETGALPACKIEAIKFDQMRSDISNLKHDVYGNGKPGLVLSVDRLTQTMERMMWTERAILAVVIGQVLYMIFGR